MAFRSDFPSWLGSLLLICFGLRVSAETPVIPHIDLLRTNDGIALQAYVTGPEGTELTGMLQVMRMVGSNKSVSQQSSFARIGPSGIAQLATVRLNIGPETALSAELSLQGNSMTLGNTRLILELPSRDP